MRQHWDEDNNVSYWQKEWYPVAGNTDLTIAVARLAGQVTTVNLGAPYRIEAAVQNVGTDTPLVGSRLGYWLKKPGEAAHTLVQDDGSDANELSSGRLQWEVTSPEGFLADRVGVHDVIVCADYQGSTPETNENNNCRQFTFDVALIAPDLVVSDMYIRVGGSYYRNGGTIKRNSIVHPYCTVSNIGNSSLHPGFRLAYYINADKYRDSDGVDPNQLCAGCARTEYVSNDNIRLGDKGTRTYQCCVDYLGQVPELNENNNCAVMVFYVR